MLRVTVGGGNITNHLEVIRLFVCPPYHKKRLTKFEGLSFWTIIFNIISVRPLPTKKERTGKNVSYDGLLQP